MKLQFQCDYNEGAHPLIIQRLTDTNFVQTPGYGEDEFCAHAHEIIRRACQAPDADVHFLVGGTQTNVTVISSALRPHQGVLCADTGHINVHETGAVEHSGHKVLALSSTDGKITAAQVSEALQAHHDDVNFEHMVQPGMVYISFPTEYGTLYTLAELEAISSVCRKWRVPLFVDGARLGYGLMSHVADVTLPDIARLADVFYIGGTKQGALFGEAVVITSETLKRDFRYNIKQNGGMLAKGRLLGIQFETLFTDNLYFEMAAHADRQAMRIHEAFASKGIPFHVDSPTNQQFPILSDYQREQLDRDFLSDFWCRIDDNHCCVRYCTSWATLETSVDRLVEAIRFL